MQNTLKSIQSVVEILGKYDHYIFDMDGVLWIGNQIIQSGVNAAQQLLANGKQVYFLTNNSTKSRKTVLETLYNLRIQTDLEHVYTSSYLVAIYLKQNNIKNAYNMGMAGISEECHHLGIEIEESKQFFENENVTYDVFEQMNPSVNLDAVVTGYNSIFNYKMLCYGCKIVGNGAQLIAANPDSYINVGGYKMPAGGCIQAIMEKATGKQAIMVGKPSATALDLIMESHKIQNKDRIIMIGDNPETDIDFGINSKIDTILVTTGVTSVEQSVNVNCTYICDHLWE